MYSPSGYVWSEMPSVSKVPYSLPNERSHCVTSLACQKSLPRETCPRARGRTLLAGSGKRFVWASIADIYGIPGIPEWANWFADELDTHRAVIHALGIGCDPVIVKGEKEQFLDWLSWGVESGAIRFPAETGSIRWPSMSLEDIFPQAE